MKRVFVILLVCIGLCGCTPVVHFPDAGSWYCPELDLQICFDNNGHNNQTYVVVNGEKQLCAYDINIGNPTIWVGYNDPENEIFMYDHTFFVAEFLFLSENELAVCETDTGTVYVFYRQQ